MNEKEILKHVDHTLLTQTATWAEIRQICDDAVAVPLPHLGPHPTMMATTIPTVTITASAVLANRFVFNSDLPRSLSTPARRFWPVCHMRLVRCWLCWWSRTGRLCSQAPSAI